MQESIDPLTSIHNVHMKNMAFTTNYYSYWLYFMQYNVPLNYIVKI